VPSITQYSVPTNLTFVSGIAEGTDCSLWLIGDANVIVKVTTSGAFNQYAIPSAFMTVGGITAGPDGNIWFTEFSGEPGVASGGRLTAAGKVSKLTPSGTFTEYTNPVPNTSPMRITTGPDGNLWFTDPGTNQVVKVTTSGGFTAYTIPTPNSAPGAITAGPDSNLWLVEDSKLARVTTLGAITEFSLPDPLLRPGGITTGRDGNLWVTEWSRLGAGGPGKIAKVTTSGSVTEYLVPYEKLAGGAAPFEEPGPALIVAGPDGNLWFTVGINLDNVTTSGFVTQYIIPISDGVTGVPQGITAGPDGTIWFTERALEQPDRWAVGNLGPLLTPSPQSMPAQSPRYNDRCSASQIALNWGGRTSEPTGQHTLPLTLTNTSGSGCYLFGYPGVALIDASGNILPLQYRRGGDQVVTAAPPLHVDLAPGAIAYVTVNKYRCDTSDLMQGAVVRLTLPADSTGLAASIGGNVSMDYCGAGDPGSIAYVSPFEPSQAATLST
jgi:streptogramin lyase